MHAKKSVQRSKRKKAAASQRQVGSETGVDNSGPSSLDETCRAGIQLVRTLAKATYNTVRSLEAFREQLPKEQSLEACDSVIEKLDETLAIMARELSIYVRARGRTTRSSELLFHIYGQTLGSLEDFPSIWRRCIVAEEDVDSSDSAGYWLLSALSNAVHLFQNECEKRPRLFRHWAQEQPCLPMLVFKHKAAYRKRFARLAESTELGTRCPINVSPNANYSLETPINARVFEILMDFMNAREWINFARSGDPNRAWREGATLEEQLYEQGELARELQPLYFAACDLPSLSKATAQQWADVYVMPYLEASGVDFFSAPEFAAVRMRKRVKSAATMRAEVRKDVLRSLVGLASPASPKRRKSSAKL